MKRTFPGLVSHKPGSVLRKGHLYNFTFFSLQKWHLPRVNSPLLLLAIEFFNWTQLKIHNVQCLKFPINLQQAFFKKAIGESCINPNSEATTGSFPGIQIFENWGGLNFLIGTPLFFTEEFLHICNKKIPTSTYQFIQQFILLFPLWSFVKFITNPGPRNTPKSAHKKSQN